MDFITMLFLILLLTLIFVDDNITYRKSNTGKVKDHD